MRDRWLSAFLASFSRSFRTTLDPVWQIAHDLHSDCNTIAIEGHVSIHG